MLDGVYTALVTPFDKNGAVDFEKLRELVAIQLDAGVDGIVPVGTTGESPTLNMDEHEKVIKTVVEAVDGRGKVIAGTGGNATAEAIELTQFARDCGVDATLQVTPYYNKPSQEGLRRHFEAVADIGLPVVLYNVPGRSSLAIDVETVAALARHPHIVAIKEAGGSVDRVSAITSCCDLEVLSGDDALTFPMMAVGAVGVVSVAANIIPGKMVDLVHAVLKGNWMDAAVLHKLYYPLFRAMFLDTNPVPVKAALSMMGQIEEVYRLPLCAMNADARARLHETLKSFDLL